MFLLHSFNPHYLGLASVTWVYKFTDDKGDHYRCTGCGEWGQPPFNGICKRGFGQVLVKAWCEKCEKTNIFWRHCDELRRRLKNERTG
jgi:hypothetical protein